MTAISLDEIRAFLPLTETIGTAGQPTAEQFGAVREAGYETVVNLALPTSSNALPDEAGVVAAYGMDYVAIPVVWEEPTLDDLRRFFDVMDASAGRKRFVHCAANMRVSAFMYLYRVLREGMAPERAAEDLHRIWTPDGPWREFIESALRRPVGSPGLRP